MAPWLGVSEAAAKKQIQRGTAQLAERLQGGDAALVGALDRIAQLDGSDARHVHDALRALIEQVVSSGRSNHADKAPPERRDPAAALRAAQAAEPPEPVHFRLAHDRIRRPERARFATPERARVHPLAARDAAAARIAGRVAARERRHAAARERVATLREAGAEYPKCEPPKRRPVRRAA